MVSRQEPFFGLGGSGFSHDQLDKLNDKDGPDIEFAGYPAGRISGNSKSRIPDIRLQPDTGYPAGYPANLNILDCFVQNFSVISLDKLKYSNKHCSDFEKTFILN